MEMVRNGELDHLRISFMIAGHTKFAPDRVFSSTGSSYKTEDVFNITDLQQICAKVASTEIVDRQNILQWRELLGEKYTALPGCMTFWWCAQTLVKW